MKIIQSKSYFISALLVLAALFYTQSIFATGGWTGNGGITTLDQNNPWFLGSDKIQYCLKVNKSYPLNTAAVDYMIHQSSTRWNDFFNRYQMNAGFPYSNYQVFLDGTKKKIMTEFESAKNCDTVFQTCVGKNVDAQKCHDELKSTVLFLVGESNSVVDTYLNLNGSAAGAAIRTEYNHDTLQSGGIVWIGSSVKNKSWSQTSHMLLHEIGHVFGMKHDSCWVMSQDVSHFLSSWMGIGKLEQIESPTWPYSFKTDDTLLFTSSGGTTPGVPQGYFQNKFHLAGLEQTFDFKPENNFKLTAEIGKVSFGGVNLKIIFEEDPTGKKIELAGVAQSKNYLRSLIPTLYTLWKSPSSNNVSYSTEYMDTGWVSDNLQGVLLLGTRKIPFTLERRKGLTLSLFFEEKGSWVTFGSVQYDVTTSASGSVSK